MPTFLLGLVCKMKEKETCRFSAPIVSFGERGGNELPRRYSKDGRRYRRSPHPFWWGQGESALLVLCRGREEAECPLLLPLRNTPVFVFLWRGRRWLLKHRRPTALQVLDWGKLLTSPRPQAQTVHSLVGFRGKPLCFPPASFCWSLEGAFQS